MVMIDSVRSCRYQAKNNRASTTANTPVLNYTLTSKPSVSASAIWVPATLRNTTHSLYSHGKKHDCAVAPPAQWPQRRGGDGRPQAGIDREVIGFGFTDRCREDFDQPEAQYCGRYFIYYDVGRGRLLRNAITIRR